MSTTDVDVATESPIIPDAPAVSTSPSQRGSSRRNMPKYGVTPVGGELPDNERTVGRSKLYYELLAEVAKTPGEWCEVAHFQTPTGAKSALKGLESGEREMPEGEWEIEVRKVKNPTNPVGPKHSKLYARLVG